jgi:hypothetical protein
MRRMSPVGPGRGRSPALPEGKAELSGAATGWYPPPLVGQVVLVTTCNGDATTYVAPKRWASMGASDPPQVAFNCNRGHWTARNVLRRREFVVNIPGVGVAEKVW